MAGFIPRLVPFLANAPTRAWHAIRACASGIDWLVRGRWWGTTWGYVVTILFGLLIPVAIGFFIDPLSRGELSAWYALIFLTALYVLVNALRNRRLSVDHHREVNRLVETMNRFRDEALTMPEERFLHLQNSSYRQTKWVGATYEVFPYLDTSERADRREEVAEDIRSVLDRLLNLAWDWDRQGAAAPELYRANVMLVRWANEFAGSIDLQRRLDLGLRHFSKADRKAFSATAAAFLDLALDLSTNSKRFGTPETDKLEPLALPVFDHGTHAPLINILGAPTAVGLKHHSYVGDIQNIARDIEERNGFDLTSRRQLVAYYRSNPKAHSVLALPFGEYDEAGGYDPILGVVNLYANRPDIIGSERQAQRFAYFCEPLLAEVGTLVRAYLWAELAQYKRDGAAALRQSSKHAHPLDHDTAGPHTDH